MLHPMIIDNPRNQISKKSKHQTASEQQDSHNSQGNGRSDKAIAKQEKEQHER